MSTVLAITTEGGPASADAAALGGGIHQCVPKGRRWSRHGLILTLLLSGLAPNNSVLAVEAPRTVKSLLEMRQDRVTVQTWDLSCGAAALGTVLKYQYDDPVSERDIAKALIGRGKYLDNPSLVRIREGFSLLDLKTYVDARGYTGIGYGKLEFNDLIDRAPIIVPIRANGYNHFVVFRGIWGNRVLIADPAWGNRTLTVDEFEDEWINYSKFGQVGFVVAQKGGTLPPNRLAPRSEDFVFLR
jgi:uncharacterized protein